MDILQKHLDEISKSKKFVITPKYLTKLKECIGTIENVSKQQIECINNLHTGYLKKHEKDALVKLFEQKTITVASQQVPNTEITLVIANQTEQDIEKMLDKSVSKYNGFSEKHPMDYVSYDETDSLYVFRKTGCKKIKRKNVKILCDITLKNIRDKFSGTSGEIVTQEKIIQPYKDKYLIIYNNTTDPLFDIQHILVLLELEHTQHNDKYEKFKQHITHFTVHKNEFGGYIIRELITFKIACDIVLASNKPFAQKFKEDVSNILDELRKSGQLVVTSTAMTVNTPNQIENDLVTDKQLEIMANSVNELQSYDNNEYRNLVRMLVIKGSKIIITPYTNNHVMYLFIVTIKDPLGKNRIICKVGYTFDIVERMNSLRSEYKCNFYLIALKFVESEKREKEFHKLMKTQFKTLWLPMAIKTKAKDEIYVFDKALYEEFMKIEETKQLSK